MTREELRKAVIRAAVEIDLANDVVFGFRVRIGRANEDIKRMEESILARRKERDVAEVQIPTAEARVRAAEQALDDLLRVAVEEDDR